VSERDPLELLAQVGRAAHPRPLFAESLLAECLEGLQTPSRRPLRLRLPRSRALRVLVALGVALVLAAAATATYLAARKTTTAVVPNSSQLTVISEQDGRIRGVRGSLASIAVLDTRRRLHTVWTCPKRIWCGDLTSMAWSPNGRRLAMTLDEIGGRSGYIGLHVIDVATGTDTHLGSLPIPNIEREQPERVLRRLDADSTKKLGCPFPHQVTWCRAVPSGRMSSMPVGVPIASCEPPGDQSGSPVTPMCGHGPGRPGVSSMPFGVTSRMPQLAS
jgi:hypothetical protein